MSSTADSADIQRSIIAVADAIIGRAPSRNQARTAARRALLRRPRIGSAHVYAPPDTRHRRDARGERVRRWGVDRPGASLPRGGARPVGLPEERVAARNGAG